MEMQGGKWANTRDQSKQFSSVSAFLRLCKVFQNVIVTIATILLLGLMRSSRLVPRTALNDMRSSLWRGAIASTF